MRPCRSSRENGRRFAAPLAHSASRGNGQWSVVAPRRNAFCFLRLVGKQNIRTYLSLVTINLHWGFLKENIGVSRCSVLSLSFVNKIIVPAKKCRTTVCDWRSSLVCEQDNNCKKMTAACGGNTRIGDQVYWIINWVTKRIFAKFGYAKQRKRG